jgi:hypothetical protein
MTTPPEKKIKRRKHQLRSQKEWHSHLYAYRFEFKPQT